MRERTMKAYGSWASLVAIFLCAAAGSHIIADHISARASQKKSMESKSIQPLQRIDEGQLRSKILKMTYGSGEPAVTHTRICMNAGSRPAQVAPEDNRSEKLALTSSRSLCDYSVPLQAIEQTARTGRDKRS
jgi:hypothetical protein